ncbi:hypothetical protein DRN86_04950, partial [Candidatus Geothermarchaeota archaeon]
VRPELMSGFVTGFGVSTVIKQNGFDEKNLLKIITGCLSTGLIFSIYAVLSLSPLMKAMMGFILAIWGFSAFPAIFTRIAKRFTP